MRESILTVMLFGFLALTSGNLGSAGEIYYKPPTKEVRLPDGRTVAVPELRTASDHGLGISGQIQESGVWITDVEERSPAAGVGLEMSDFIVSVNKRRIRTVQNWNQEMRKSGPLLLTIKSHRTGTTASHTVTLKNPTSRRKDKP